MGYPAWMFFSGAFPLTGAVLHGAHEGQVWHQVRASVKVFCVIGRPLLLAIH